MGDAAVSADPDPAGPVNTEVEHSGFRQAILLVKRPMEMSSRIQHNQAAALDSHNEQSVWQALPGPDRMVFENVVRLGRKRLNGSIEQFKNPMIFREHQHLPGNRFQNLLDLGTIKGFCIDQRDEMVVDNFI